MEELAWLIPLFVRDLPALDSRAQPPIDLPSGWDSGSREEGQTGESE